VGISIEFSLNFIDLLRVKKVKPQEPPLPLGEGWGEGDSNRILISLRVVITLRGHAEKQAHLSRTMPVLSPVEDRFSEVTAFYAMNIPRLSVFFMASSAEGFSICDLDSNPL
jgi:hypothetical protein